MNNYFFKDKEPNFDNDGLDPSEEYFRNKKKSNDEDTYSPEEESKSLIGYWPFSYSCYSYSFKKSRAIIWLISRNNIVPAPIIAPKQPVKK